VGLDRLGLGDLKLPEGVLVVYVWLLELVLVVQVWLLEFARSGCLLGRCLKCSTRSPRYFDLMAVAVAVAEPLLMIV